MILIYLNLAHNLINHQIPQIVFVTITKTIRGQDALSGIKLSEARNITGGLP
jgi:hypothetical protein